MFNATPRSLSTETWQERRSSFSFELWKTFSEISLQMGQAALHMGLSTYAQSNARHQVRKMPRVVLHIELTRIQQCQTSSIGTRECYTSSTYIYAQRSARHHVHAPVLLHTERVPKVVLNIKYMHQVVLHIEHIYIYPTQCSTSSTCSGTSTYRVHAQRSARHQVYAPGSVTHRAHTHNVVLYIT